MKSTKYHYVLMIKDTSQMLFIGLFNKDLMKQKDVPKDPHRQIIINNERFSQMGRVQKILTKKKRFSHMIIDKKRFLQKRKDSHR